MSLYQSKDAEIKRLTDELNAAKYTLEVLRGSWDAACSIGAECDPVSETLAKIACIEARLNSLK